jgi:hypothetical protein
VKPPKSSFLPHVPIYNETEKWQKQNLTFVQINDMMKCNSSELCPSAQDGIEKEWYKTQN